MPRVTAHTASINGIVVVNPSILGIFSGVNINVPSGITGVAGVEGSETPTKPIVDQ